MAPITLSIPPARRAECEVMLARWDARNPWNEAEVKSLTAQLIALIDDLAKPRIPDIRGGEAAAKMLRYALGE